MLAEEGGGEGQEEVWGWRWGGGGGNTQKSSTYIHVVRIFFSREKMTPELQNFMRNCIRSYNNIFQEIPELKSFRRK